MISVSFVGGEETEAGEGGARPKAAQQSRDSTQRSAAQSVLGPRPSKLCFTSLRCFPPNRLVPPVCVFSGGGEDSGGGPCPPLQQVCVRSSAVARHPSGPRSVRTGTRPRDGLTAWEGSWTEPVTFLGDAAIQMLPSLADSFSNYLLSAIMCLAIKQR